MSKTTKLLVTILVVIVAAAAIVLLVGREDDNGTDKNTTNNTNSSESNDSSEPGEATTITYDGNAFTPASVTVPIGTTLKFVNESDKTVEPSSDDHPTHTKNPELNVGDVAPGQSKEVTVDTSGEWEMHNHYDASQKLTVRVE